ncbi:MAG: ammonium transporter [Lachnospiraceae bacterium]|nr:ammonium transporter [Lachnospiraceae bacterium]
MNYSVTDTLWVFFTAILVFFMNLGFAAVEAGFARAKNTVNILSKNFIVFAVSSLGFLFLGWGIMFGGTNPIIGTSHLWILNGDTSYYDNTLTSTVPFWGKFFFELVFCGTAATIVSGAVAERIKYVSFIIFSFVLTLFIYPVIGHWIWGGGWLAQLGFQDFSGDTVVHSLGGWSALAGAWILGPRIGKYDKDGKARAIPGHNMSLAVIGLFVLWLGWFGFNPGSTLTASHPDDIMMILMNTNTAAVGAIITSTITSWIVIGKPDLGMTVNGCLAGLVVITAGCAYVTPGASLIMGLISGVVVVYAVLFFDRIHIDDPVGACAVHLCNGVLGTIEVGLFAKAGVTSVSKVNGLFYGGGAHLLGVQLLGVVSVGAFSFICAVLVWKVLEHTVGIRVTPEEEIQGLDIGEHGNVAYPDFAPATATAFNTNIDDVTSPAGGLAASSAMKKNGTTPVVSPAEAVPVVADQVPGASLTKVTIICNQTRFSELQDTLEAMGISGITVTNVFGHGMQKGHVNYFRGAPMETKLLPKIKLDVVISKISTDDLIHAVRNTLYTGNVGDGKVFVYDVRDVVKIRTNEHGYEALQDE